jgi:hypothetical protein
MVPVPRHPLRGLNKDLEVTISDLLQYFVSVKEEVISVRYAFAEGETRRRQCYF